MSNDEMKALASAVLKQLPMDIGCTVLVFKFTDPTLTNYISTANKAVLIEQLRRTADRLEGKEELKTPENNIH